MTHDRLPHGLVITDPAGARHGSMARVGLAAVAGWGRMSATKIEQAIDASGGPDMTRMRCGALETRARGRHARLGPVGRQRRIDLGRGGGVRPTTPPPGQAPRRDGPRGMRRRRAHHWISAAPTRSGRLAAGADRLACACAIQRLRCRPKGNASAVVVYVVADGKKPGRTAPPRALDGAATCRPGRARRCGT